MRQEPKVWPKAIDTPTPCSCFMCGNPRKWWKSKTLREISDAEFYKACLSK